MCLGQDCVPALKGVGVEGSASLEWMRVVSVLRKVVRQDCRHHEYSTRIVNLVVVGMLNRNTWS